VQLARRGGGEAVGASFLIELTPLKGPKALDVLCQAVLRD
jgi:adenine/guanine phosphoribosyltransferase-like PRPP-binding protein